MSIFWWVAKSILYFLMQWLAQWETLAFHQCFQVWFVILASYVGWGGWFSPLLCKVFAQVLQFCALLIQDQPLIWFGLYEISSIIIQLSYTVRIPIFWLVDLYHVTVGYDATTSLTSLSWCNSPGVNSIHHCHYTMALADSKFDDFCLQCVQFE